MAIHVEAISKRFGGAVALDDVSLEVPDRLAHRAARSERRRQVDPPAHGRRTRGTRLGHGRSSTART